MQKSLSHIAPLRLREFFAQLVYVPRALRLVWAAAPAWSVTWAALLVVLGVLPAGTVYLTRILVDSLAAALGAGVTWQNIQPTVIAAVLMALIMLSIEVVQSLLEWVRTGQSERVRDHLSGLVHEKAVAADLAHYETPEYHDRLHQASSDLKTRPLSLLESGGNFIQSGITLVAMGALLLPFGLWVPLLLVASTLPGFFLVVLFDRKHHRWWQRTTVDRRWAQYYDSVLLFDTTAPEVRLFNLGAHFQAAFQLLRGRLRSELLDLAKQQVLARLAAGVLGALIAGAALAWMVWQAFLGLVTLGDVALFYQALSKGQNLLRNLLNNAGRIYNNTLFLENLFQFFEIKPSIVDPVEPVPAPSKLSQGIRFRRVSFRYPGSERAVLQDFDFDIPAGSVVAIMGANGAGKTTVAKLLCRLYDPEAGSIEFDGIDIRNLRVKDLRRMITGMFQLPAYYFSTASDNIALGDLDAAASSSDIMESARRSGADGFISGLPKGYDTLLGKWFPEGVELSGGEWQRLALARSYFRKAPIIVLDEPTSFLDSWSESDWFARFRELASGLTAVLITHRLTIARHADVIHIMEQGRVVESGSHEVLLSQGGRYARSWIAQTQARPEPSGPDRSESGFTP